MILLLCGSSVLRSWLFSGAYPRWQSFPFCLESNELGGEKTTLETNILPCRREPPTGAVSTHMRRVISVVIENCKLNTHGVRARVALRAYMIILMSQGSSGADVLFEASSEV